MSMNRSGSTVESEDPVAFWHILIEWIILILIIQVQITVTKTPCAQMVKCQQQNCIIWIRISNKLSLHVACNDIHSASFSHLPPPFTTCIHSVSNDSVYLAKLCKKLCCKRVVHAVPVHAGGVGSIPTQCLNTQLLPLPGPDLNWLGCVCFNNASWQ